MTSYEVSDALVEKAAREIERMPYGLGWPGSLAVARAAIAAVLPEIQAQALQPFFDLRLRVANSPFEALTRDSVVRSLDAALHTARLTTPTEEPTDA